MRELWFIDDAPVFGGGQRNVLRLAQFIDSSVSGCAVRVACPEGTELAERCRAAGLPVRAVGFPGRSEVLRIGTAVRRLRRMLSGVDDDAVFVGASLRAQVYMHAAVLGSRRRRPIVHFMVERDSARRLTTRLVLRRAVVAMGGNAAASYRRALPKVHVEAVNNFLLPEEFDAARAIADSCVTTPPTVGVLARLIPEKGVLELVRELADVPETWSTLLVGGARQDEGYSSGIERCVVSRGLANRVELLGAVDDLAAFFSQVDVLVVPSTGNEGQPTAIVEALAHGRSVLVRQPSGHRSSGASRCIRTVRRPTCARCCEGWGKRNESTAGRCRGRSGCSRCSMRSSEQPANLR